VLIADQDLPDSSPDLLPRLAEHLDTWMTRPPITFFRGFGHEQIEAPDQMECLVGPLDPNEARVLGEQLPRLKQQLVADGWEIIAKPTL
jgi:hypothetical protein